jgi:hypothetical protein
MATTRVCAAQTSAHKVAVAFFQPGRVLFAHRLEVELISFMVF